MSDPLRDPRFPNRPQHPDFWRMSDVVLKLDGRADSGTLEKAADGLVDFESLVYMAEQRVDSFLRATGLPTSVRTVLITMFVTSFITGIEFEKAGGHR